MIAIKIHKKFNSALPFGLLWFACFITAKKLLDSLQALWGFDHLSGSSIVQDRNFFIGPVGVISMDGLFHERRKCGMIDGE